MICCDFFERVLVKKKYRQIAKILFEFYAALRMKREWQRGQRLVDLKEKQE